MGVSPQYPRGRRIQRPRLVRFESCWRADRSTSAVVDPTTIFASLVPWLILFATVVFAIGHFAPVGAIQRIQLGPRRALVPLFLIAIYGGYFGGGIGFLMLAAFTLFGMRDIHAMNGLKMGLVGVMTITAVVTFIAANVVRWPEVLPMFASPAIGAYMAAH